MSTLILVLIPVLMSAIAMIVVLVREGQFQQISTLLETRHFEMNVLKKEVAAATTNALSALQRVSETQTRLEAAEAESVTLREKLSVVSFKLGQERLKRDASEEAAREFKTRSQELDLRCQGLEQQCRDLVTSGQATEARAVAAEAEAAELQQRVAQLLQELHEMRLTAQEGAQTAVRTAAAAAQVARVERAIHAQTEELMAALDVLRRESEGLLCTENAGAEEAEAQKTTPPEAQTLILQQSTPTDAAEDTVAAPMEVETVRHLLPHAAARLTWAQPNQAVDRQIEAVAS